MLILFLAGLFVGACIAEWRKNKAWQLLAFAGLMFGGFYCFIGSSINALFLHQFGTYGSAVITHEEQTNSTLNDQYIWAYDGVLRTADGRDVKISFDTMSASLYPPRNEIDIPPEGERFVVKYIPGFERNVAIMRDESAFGIRLIVEKASQDVEGAANQLAASPGNHEFQQEYRQALVQFLNRYANQADPALVTHYRAELQALDHPGSEAAQ
ncbi:hypothetical protein [Silvibacterium dinghuense]|uniref:Uncharacterized protein n=1 Tax=Silvibacterium dinghuense TaxID=1560006 RepID=A0A4V1NVU4_9BACT|nr:hypothetical protein [Silvibacterium dinghuense]RXS97132.1 hypothetical protein ESZ00_04225 [Silvibacterium dinghuense]